MTTPTPRHGPGQMPPPGGPPGWPQPYRQPPKKRGGVRGLVIGLGVAVVFFGGLAAVGAASGDGAGSAPSTTRSGPATAPAAASKATEVQLAECEFKARMYALEKTPETDLAEIPECAPLNSDQVAAVWIDLPEPLVTGAGIDGVPLAAPKGVVASGDASDVIRIRSFKAKRDYFGSFAPVLRLENTGVAGEDFEYIGVKVTALRGEDVIATADGIIETIAGGQTITHEPLSADDFPKSTAGITYEVELGS